MRKSNCFCFFLLIFFSSCVEEADIKLPDYEPELVIAAFLNPEDTQAEVVVTSTTNVYGSFSSEPQYVTNAAVYLMDASDTVVLSFNAHPDSMFYYVKEDVFKITAGQTYYLFVEAPGFESVSASCTVPAGVVSQLIFELEKSRNGNNDSTYRVSLKWPDLPGEINYYRTVVQVIDSFQGVSGMAEFQYEFFFNTEHYSDAGENGQWLTSEKGEALIFGQNQVKSRHLKIFLLTTDENYSAYHESLNRYSGNALFTEPSNIFSNVKQGKGAFGAYRRFVHLQKLF